MSTEHRCGNWVEHFPGNLKWSNATQIVKGMAPWAAVALEEIDRIGERMKARTGEADLDAVWIEEWSAMADRLAAVADRAAAEGRQITAGNNYMRAGNYYYSAERFIRPGEAKTAMYRRALRCYHGGLERLYPQIEKIDVPYEGKTLAAYFIKGQGVTGKAPTVVLFDGLDNCKEMSVIFAGLEFAKRGISTLAIDGPGQGESLRLRNINTRPDYEVAGTAAYDYVTSRADVDPAKVAIMGYSFGGYHAPRIAAVETRYAACVALGAMHWDMYAWQKEIRDQIAANPTSSGANSFQWRWVLGAPDDATALEWSKRFTLIGFADRITCPVLITHGQNDRLVRVEEAEKMFALIGSKNKQLKIFGPDEGGTEHCQVDNRQMGIDYIADWLMVNMQLPMR